MSKKKYTTFVFVKKQKQDKKLRTESKHPTHEFTTVFSLTGVKNTCLCGAFLTRFKNCTGGFWSVEQKLLSDQSSY